MKDTFGLVPQVFYDLIGRVAPGAATILAGLVLLSDRSPVDAVALLTGKQAISTSAALVVAAWLLASYLVGTLLGAVAFASFKDDRHNRRLRDGLGGFWAVLGFTRSEDAKQCRDLGAIKADEPAGKEIGESNLSYIYDFILLRDAGAGGRLAKLRAEIHMCRVLILACVGLGTAYVIQRFPLIRTGGFWPTLTVLVAIARASYLLDVHLAVRSRRLMMNCWDILKKEDVRMAAANKAAQADSSAAA